MLRDDLSPRIYFDEPVSLQLEGDGLTFEGRAHNLSPSGIFVGSVDPLPVDTRIALSFDLPDGSLFSAVAVVVRTVLEASAVEPVGMALRFDEIDEICAEWLRGFIDQRLQPATGERVRLSLGDVAVPIATRAQSSFGNILSVDAELPFLRLGSEVSLNGERDESLGAGSIRWVSVHICPETGVPRLNIGIELNSEHQVEVDEEFDPVCTDDFALHAEALDQQIRAERKRGGEQRAN